MSLSAQKRNIYNLCFAAIMIALGTVLSFIKLWEMPLGGSVTLCDMLPVMLVGYFLGVKWGLASAFIFSLIQMFSSLGSVMSWGLSSTVLVACLFLDYIIPYTLLGLSGLFRGKHTAGEGLKPNVLPFALGMVFVVVLRFVCHFISGVFLFQSWAQFQPAWFYSICYNGAYLLPDLIMCVVVGVLIYQPVCAASKSLLKAA